MMRNGYYGNTPAQHPGYSNTTSQQYGSFYGSSGAGHYGSIS